jgi:hypothetical protein
LWTVNRTSATNLANDLVPDFFTPGACGFYVLAAQLYFASTWTETQRPEPVAKVAEPGLRTGRSRRCIGLVSPKATRWASCSSSGMFIASMALGTANPTAAVVPFATVNLPERLSMRC